MRVSARSAGAILIGFGVIGASTANATTITPTFTSTTGAGFETFSASTGANSTDFFTVFNIPQFNSALGNLTQITVTVGGTMTATGTLTNSSSSAATGTTISQNSTITDASPQFVAGSFGSVTINGGTSGGDTFLVFTTSANGGSSVGTIAGNTTVSNINLSGSFTPSTVTQTSGFDPNLIGLGTYGVTFNTGEYTTSGGSGGNITASASTQDNLNLSITYNYSTPQISTPEPASMALIGSGLAGIGAVTRRRRKR